MKIVADFISALAVMMNAFLLFAVMIVLISKTGNRDAKHYALLAAFTLVNITAILGGLFV